MKSWFINLQLCLLLSFGLTGCNWFFNDPRNPLMQLPSIDSTYGPGPMMVRNLPDGDDSYSQGFRDGCETYVGMQGTGFVQMKEYSWDNNRMISDPMYNKGIVDGRNYCTYVWHPAVN